MARDDLDRLQDDVLADPVARQSYEDQLTRDQLFQHMVRTRGALSQSAVAASMRTTQSAVSDLEHGRVDPRLSTLQRYARAVGGWISIGLTTNGAEAEGVSDAVSVGDDYSLAAVLTTLMKDGRDRSRSADELADLTRLPVAAVDRTVDRLWRTGWIEGSAPSRTASGRVGLKPERGVVIGVSLTPGWAHGVLTDLRTAEVVVGHDEQLADTRPRTVIEAGTRLVERLGQQVRKDQELIGLGVALAGLVAGTTGTVLFAPDLEEADGVWANTPLAAELQEATGLSTIVENDGNVLAIAEYLRTGDEHDLAVVIMSESGEGIGGGLVANGEILRGAGGVSNEFGHLTVGSERRPCRCGSSRGCLETVASAKAILARISERRKAVVQDLREMAGLADAGDQATGQVLDQAGKAVGTMLAQLSIIVSPPRIVVFGPSELTAESGFASARRFMSAIRRCHDDRQFGVKLELVAKVLGSSTVALAAAAAAVHYFLASPRQWVPGIVPDPEPGESAAEPTPVPFVRVQTRQANPAPERRSGVGGSGSGGGLVKARGHGTR